MAGITYQEVQDQYSGSSPNTIPMTVACAPKTDLFVAFAALKSYQFWADVSVADDVNGAYTPLCLYWDVNYGGGCAICMFFCASTGTGTPNVTLTWDGGYYGGNCAVLHYNGFVNGAVLDVNTLVGGVPANGYSAIAAAGPYTTTNANEVLVAMLVNGGWSYNPTNPPGWSWRNADGDFVLYDSIVSSIQTGQSLSGTMNGTNPQYWDLPLFSFYDAVPASTAGPQLVLPRRKVRSPGGVAMDLNLKEWF